MPGKETSSIHISFCKFFSRVFVYYRYRDFRDKEGRLTAFYWHLLASKLCFVIVFEHFVFATHRLIDFLVPDIPKELDIAIKKEAYQAKKLMSHDISLIVTKSEDEISEQNLKIK
nr:anoctamin-7-like [Hydra vulgaris]